MGLNWSQGMDTVSCRWSSHSPSSHGYRNRSSLSAPLPCRCCKCSSMASDILVKSCFVVVGSEPDSVVWFFTSVVESTLLPWLVAVSATSQGCLLFLLPVNGSVSFTPFWEVKSLDWSRFFALVSWTFVSAVDSCLSLSDIFNLSIPPSIRIFSPSSMASTLTSSFAGGALPAGNAAPWLPTFSCKELFCSFGSFTKNGLEGLLEIICSEVNFLLSSPFESSSPFMTSTLVFSFAPIVTCFNICRSFNKYGLVSLSEIFCSRANFLLPSDLVSTWPVVTSLPVDLLTVEFAFANCWRPLAKSIASEVLNCLAPLWYSCWILEDVVWFSSSSFVRLLMLWEACIASTSFWLLFCCKATDSFLWSSGKAFCTASAMAPFCTMPWTSCFAKRPLSFDAFCDLESCRPPDWPAASDLFSPAVLTSCSTAAFSMALFCGTVKACWLATSGSTWTLVFVDPLSPPWLASWNCR